MRRDYFAPMRVVPSPRTLLLLLLPACVSPNALRNSSELRSSELRSSELTLGRAPAQRDSVGPVAGPRTSGWAIRTSIETSKFDIKQPTAFSLTTGNTAAGVGPKEQVEAQLMRMHQAVSYATDRFVFEGLLGASTFEVDRWRDDGADLSIGTRVGARLAEFGALATSASLQLSHNQSENLYLNSRSDGDWFEGDLRLAAAILPQPDTGRWVSPYAGLAYRRIDGRHDVPDLNAEAKFDANLVYGFVGVNLLPSAAWQLTAEGMLGDVMGLQLAMTFTF